MIKSNHFKSALAALTVAALIGLAGCGQDEPITAPAVSANGSTADKAAIHKKTGFVVANFSPAFGNTDGIVRYDGHGDLVDVMVPAGTADLTATFSFTFGPDDNLYLSDPFAGGVKRFHGLTGEYMDDFIPAGSGGLALTIYLLFHGDYLYVGDGGSSAVRRYDAVTGDYIDDFIPPGDQGMTFGDPQDIEFGPDGNLYVAAQNQGRVLRYDGDSGAYMDDFPSAGPSGLAFGDDGMMYVGDLIENAVWRFDIATGTFVDVFVPSGSGGLETPVGIVFGPDGDLYVASASQSGTGSILRFDGQTGDFVEVFVPTGLGGLSGPRVIAFKETVTLCHQPPGDPADSKTLTLPYLNGFGHVGHGDPLGPCQ